MIGAVMIGLVATWLGGFICGRLMPTVPRFYRRRRGVLPGARLVLERRRDHRADITVAIGGFARRLP